MTRAVFRTCLLSLLLLTFACAENALAQLPSRGTKAFHTIEFAPGKTTATLKGTVSLPHGEGDMHDNGAERYILHYRAGQTVSISLQSEGSRAAFSVLTDNYEAVGIPQPTTHWSGKLPATGDYYITVFTDKAATDYTLKVMLRSVTRRR